jgi:hypothetical protein
MPFFDSFLMCFSLRFSFSDLPTFLTLCWFGDLSATLSPPVGDVTVGDVEITDYERPPKVRVTSSGNSRIWFLMADFIAATLPDHSDASPSNTLRIRNGNDSICNKINHPSISSSIQSLSEGANRIKGACGKLLSGHHRPEVGMPPCTGDLSRVSNPDYGKVVPAIGP